MAEISLLTLTIASLLLLLHCRTITNLLVTMVTMVTMNHSLPLVFLQEFLISTYPLPQTLDILRTRSHQSLEEVEAGSGSPEETGVDSVPEEGLTLLQGSLELRVNGFLGLTGEEAFTWTDSVRDQRDLTVTAGEASGVEALEAIIMTLTAVGGGGAGGAGITTEDLGAILEVEVELIGNCEE